MNKINKLNDSLKEHILEMYSNKEKIRQIQDEIFYHKKYNKCKTWREQMDICKEIKDKLMEFSGKDVSCMGRRVKFNFILIKHMFWREGFERGISGTVLSYYTGDTSRFAPYKGRKLLIEKCKKDFDIKEKWNNWKQFIKNNEKKEQKTL